MIHHSWRLKTWSYKRCPKCGNNIKYENLFDLYVLKDIDATWNCPHCNYQERISLEELLGYCQEAKKVPARTS